MTLVANLLPSMQFIFSARECTAKSGQGVFLKKNKPCIFYTGSKNLSILKLFLEVLKLCFVIACWYQDHASSGCGSTNFGDPYPPPHSLSGRGYKIGPMWSQFLPSQLNRLTFRPKRRLQNGQTPSSAPVFSDFIKKVMK